MSLLDLSVSTTLLISSLSHSKSPIHRTALSRIASAIVPVSPSHLTTQHCKALHLSILLAMPLKRSGQISNSHSLMSHCSLDNRLIWIWQSNALEATTWISPTPSMADLLNFRPSTILHWSLSMCLMSVFEAPLLNSPSLIMASLDSCWPTAHACLKRTWVMERPLSVLSLSDPAFCRRLSHPCSVCLPAHLISSLKSWMSIWPRLVSFQKTVICLETQCKSMISSLHSAGMVLSSPQDRIAMSQRQLQWSLGSTFWDGRPWSSCRMRLVRRVGIQRCLHPFWLEIRRINDLIDKNDVQIRCYYRPPLVKLKPR